MHPILTELAERIASPQPLSQQGAQGLVPLLERYLPEIMSLARLTASTASESGKSAFTCGIINAKSGRCKEDCAFCAQSAHHDTDAAVYGLVDDDTLLARAEALAAAGVDYFGIVISGTGPTEADFERLCNVAGRITSTVGIRLCASLGIIDAAKAQALKEAGFTSYHHNLEAARSFYPTICSTHGIDDRISTVEAARAAGLRVCSGGIFGLGESWAQRLELAGMLAELDVDSIPVNFLTPIPGTPLENAQGLSPTEALGLIALVRLMHPGRDIVICGGRTRTLKNWEEALFFAGANGLMVGDYLTTANNPLERDMTMLRELGLK